MEFTLHAGGTTKKWPVKRYYNELQSKPPDGRASV